MRISIYGASDDLIEVDMSDLQHKEFYANGLEDSDIKTVIRIATPGGRAAIDVYAIYVGEGVWGFAPTMVGDEDGPKMPEWTITTEQGKGHSAEVTINTGTDLVEVTRLELRGGGWWPPTA